jgi:CheY-like chemotaxis protein
LIIDDDVFMRDVLSDLLVGRGFEVEACEDALQALSRLRAGLAPHVILLDLRLPGMDGWEFRVIQKAHPSWSQIPLVAVSGDSSAKAAAIDAEAFLAKPICHKALLETVERLVKVMGRREGRELDVAVIREAGNVAAGIAEQLSPAVMGLMENLRLAQRKLSELERRVGSAEAFSLLGIRQLVLSAERSSERVHGVLNGVALFSEIALHTLQGKRRVLVAHSEARLALLLRAALSEDHDVLVVHEGRAAERALREDSFDVVLCELALPALDGIALYEGLLPSRPEQAARMVFLTAAGGFGERERSFFARHRPWQLRAPFEAAEVRELIEAQWRAFH